MSNVCLSCFHRVVPQTSDTSTRSSPTCPCPPPCAQTPRLWPAASRKQREPFRAFLTGLRQTTPLCEHLCISVPRTYRKQDKSSGSRVLFWQRDQAGAACLGDVIRGSNWQNGREYRGTCAWLVYRWGLSCYNNTGPTLLPQPPKTNNTCAKYALWGHTTSLLSDDSGPHSYRWSDMKRSAWGSKGSLDGSNSIWWDPALTKTTKLFHLSRLLTRALAVKGDAFITCLHMLKLYLSQSSQCRFIFMWMLNCTWGNKSQEKWNILLEASATLD